MEPNPQFKTNLDTNFLKLIAILSMLVDHVGGVFFPQYPVFRWIGRLAFPLFCYCMTVGLVYTHDVKRYMGRLMLFAVIAQPFYILAFNPQAFWENLTNWNIFFTLVLSLLAMWGFKEHRWWLFIGAFFVISWWNFDYSSTGIILMLIFFLCRQKPALGATFYILSYLPAFFFGNPDDPLSLMVAGHAIGFEAFCLLALPLIYCTTHVAPKIPKWFFYGFYPVHLAVIFIVRWILKV